MQRRRRGEESHPGAKRFAPLLLENRVSGSAAVCTDDRGGVCAKGTGLEQKAMQEVGLSQVSAWAGALREKSKQKVNPPFNPDTIPFKHGTS